MKPSHLTIVGGTGSGKTSAARIWVHNCPRLLVLDHSEDAIWDSLGGTFRDAGRAVDFYRAHAADDFQAVLRFRQSETYLAFLEGLYVLHRDHPLPPTVVVMEEATIWSETHDIPESLEAVVTRGRRAGLVLVSIAQETTQVHPSIRRQAFLTVTLRQTPPLPSDLQASLTRQEERQVRGLSTVDPYTWPVEGDHYLTVPPGEDPYRHLLAAVDQHTEPLPEDYQPPRPDTA